MHVEGTYMGAVVKFIKTALSHLWWLPYWGGENLSEMVKLQTGKGLHYVFSSVKAFIYLSAWKWQALQPRSPKSSCPWGCSVACSATAPREQPAQTPRRYLLRSWGGRRPQKDKFPAFRQQQTQQQVIQGIGLQSSAPPNFLAHP